MRSESAVEQRACELVYETLGIMGVKVVAVGQRGFPDRMFLIPGGKPLFIEFKQPGGDLSPHQVRMIKTLKKLNYNVEVCDNYVSALKTAIDTVAKGRLSKDSRRLLSEAKRRCALLSARSRQNIHHP